MTFSLPLPSPSYLLKLPKCYSHTFLCQVVAYKTLKTKENPKLSALKVVAVAYERFQPYSDLTWKFFFDILENWLLERGGRLQKVVAKGGSTLLVMLNILCFLFSFQRQPDVVATGRVFASDLVSQ